jgi:hypothetical protein
MRQRVLPMPSKSLDQKMAMNLSQAGEYMTDPTYALGRSDDEHARLTEQANFLRPLTERFFRKAGIAPGMKVLDVGSGVGDVAFFCC